MRCPAACAQCMRWRGSGARPNHRLQTCGGKRIGAVRRMLLVRGWPERVDVRARRRAPSSISDRHCKTDMESGGTRTGQKRSPSRSTAKAETWKQKRANMRASVSMRVRGGGEGRRTHRNRTRPHTHGVTRTALLARNGSAKKRTLRAWLFLYILILMNTLRAHSSEAWMRHAHQNQSAGLGAPPPAAWELRAGASRA